MHYLIPDYNRPGKQRLVTNHFGWLEDHVHCLVGPFSREDEAREEAHAIEIAAANWLPESGEVEEAWLALANLGDLMEGPNFFQREGEWFAERFQLTEAEYADLVENQEAR